MEIEDFIEHLTAWHESQVEQLNLVFEHPDAPIKFQGADGFEVELTAQQAKGFRIGVKEALRRLGTLPFSVSQDEEE